MGPQQRLHSSKQSTALHLGLDASKLEPLLGLLANTLIHLDRLCRHDVEQLLAVHGCELLLYLDLCRYDETPMKANYHQTVEVFSVTAGADSTPPHYQHGRGIRTP